ncbi:hypothetical protein B0H21DRAFT_778509 [Amylocystis lapponica]|nr:hypothetical protein B0H21DRAFT_778509 [Amylocystis lapponica]
MSNGAYEKFNSSRTRKNSSTDDEDDLYDHDNDEDYTARLSDGHRAAPKTPVTDNMTALQRVKNLTQRNRMVLDKLTSISRHNSPAPRSPFSPPTATSSSSSSSRPSARIRPQSVSDVPVNNIHRDSGSETERESQHAFNHSNPSSDDLSETPPLPSDRFSTPIHAPVPTRQRRISAPASPAKAMKLTRDRDRGPSPGPSRTQRKRISMVNAGEINYEQREDDEQDVMAAALAAVALSRRSPTGSGGKKNRQPLPKEFRERDRRSSDGKPVGEPPTTPHRHPDRSYLGRASPSPKASGSGFPNSNVQTSPRRAGASRFSTVRELTRKHQTRWLSEDLTGSFDADDDPQEPNGGRRQGHRLGSSEGMLAGPNGRSLVGEGLRAAGLAKRRDIGDDVFTEPDPPQSQRRTKSTGNSSIIQGEYDSPVEQAMDAGSSTRINEGVGPPSNRYDPRTPAQRQNGNHIVLTRPGTSMAALHHESIDNPPRTAPPALRAYRSAYPLDKNAAQQSDYESPSEATSSTNRGLGTPFGTLRSSNLPPSAVSNSTRDQSAEHRRLMLESLGMFEGQLSRLPPMGQTTTSTIPELFQSAQHLVHTLDKLNGKLKAGTNGALESQIEAEVADHAGGVDLAGLWRQVGSEHRENLRASDEVVRNMTGFLLNVGRVLREAAALGGHLRSASLDEEAIMTRRMTPDGASVGSGGRSSEGRKSRETRRSWDPSPRNPAELLRRVSSRERGQRPGSSLNKAKSSETSSSEGRSVADAVGEQTPQTVRNTGGSGLLPSSSIARRLYAPRDRVTPESISAHAPLATFSSQDSLVSHEPSPTPASRYSAQTGLPERYRSPVAVAPSLSTLPSESLLNRNHTIATDKSTRRKISSNSNITVRAEPSPSLIRPPNTTTAVTPMTVTHSPESPFLPPRSDSRNGATFSRASTISVSTLSGLQQQHERGSRERTASNASFVNERVLSPATVISPVSGLGPERDSRYRTLGGRPRISLDAAMEEAERDAGSLSRASTLSNARRERRRTITEIFSER